MIDVNNHSHSDLLKFIYINKRLHHNCLNIKFYEKRNIIYIYNEILNRTNFLDSYDVLLRERIFYIEQEFSTVQMCQYCNVNKLGFRFNTIRLDNSCKSDQCKKSHRDYVANNKPRKNISVTNICVGCKNEFQTIPCERRKYCCRACYTQNREEYHHSPETKRKISDSNIRVHNTKEFKHRMKVIQDDPEYRKNLSDKMKISIFEGKFTPCITNTWTHWDAKVNLSDGTTKKFRSSWEACFWLYHPYLQYEKIRIPYQFKNENKIYIIDFVDLDNRILFEIKPDSCINNEQNIAKISAANIWCLEHQFKFQIIGNSWFKNNISADDHPNNKNIIDMVMRGI